MFLVGQAELPRCGARNIPRPSDGGGGGRWRSQTVRRTKKGQNTQERERPAPSHPGRRHVFSISVTSAPTSIDGEQKSIQVSTFRGRYSSARKRALEPSAPAQCASSFHEGVIGEARVRVGPCLTRARAGAPHLDTTTSRDRCASRAEQVNQRRRASPGAEGVTRFVKAGHEHRMSVWTSLACQRPARKSGPSQPQLAPQERHLHCRTWERAQGGSGIVRARARHRRRLSDRGRPLSSKRRGYRGPCGLPRYVRTPWHE